MLRTLFVRLSLVVWLALVMARPAAAQSLAAPIDLPRCGGSPEGGVAVSVEGPAVRFRIHSDTPMARIRLALREPLATTGKERFLLEGRAEESSGLGVCIARVEMLAPGGGIAATYEPDILFPPEWNLREVLFRDFLGPMPKEIAALDVHLWVPHEKGKEYAFLVRRCEVQSVAEVAAAQQPPSRAPRRALPPRPTASAGSRSWESFGPGGGGWYRTVAFSPQVMLLAYCRGPDKRGGALRSADGGAHWAPSNEGLPRTPDVWSLTGATQAPSIRLAQAFRHLRHARRGSPLGAVEPGR